MPCRVSKLENVSARMACSLGCRPPPPTPCRTRKENQHSQAGCEGRTEKLLQVKERDAGHVKNVFRPMMVESHALIGKNDGVGKPGSWSGPMWIPHGWRKKTAGNMRQ